MDDSSKKQLTFFGFGTNKDLAMMQHIVGRDDLKGVPGKIIGYEVCVMKSRDMRREIPKTSPVQIEPAQIIIDAWGPDFDMFVMKPNSKSVAHGMFWEFDEKDLELVNEWECVEYGLQDLVEALGMDENGNFVQVLTHSLRTDEKVDYAVSGEDYEPYVVAKEKMLEAADKTREAYLKLKNEQKQGQN